MSHRVAIINVVGLTRRLIGADTPRLEALVQRRGLATVTPAFPAVTCTAQSNYLTGALPSQHGIVSNGWYNRDLAETHFWKQSNAMVHAPKIWDELRSAVPDFTCATLFWWYNMYSGADFTISPRPMYPADGRKVFDIYTQPASVRHEIKRDLGEFPFATFWGPVAGVNSPQGPPQAASSWIAKAARWVEEKFHPTLNLIYLPHLDYSLQRLGPAHPGLSPDLRAVDALVGELLDFFAQRGVEVMLLSEYGITAVDRPVHLNRLFREQGWLAIRPELGLELLDCGASRVFAVADHQVAHIYLKDRSLEAAVRKLVANQPGVAAVLGASEKRACGLDHERAGDLIAVAQENAWFTYYYWMDDALAPDFARTVDIHRKPGYDPVELFLDPKLQWPKLHIARRLLQKKLGFRMLMDVIPLDATLVKGSHGVRPVSELDWPVLIPTEPHLLPESKIESTAVYEAIKKAVLG